MRIAIIGAGLAGTSCAYVLRQYGLSPEIYESGHEIALGASGNFIGLVNPRLSADRTPESDFYAAGFSLAVRRFEEFQAEEDIGWKKCGGLHLMVEDKKQKRFPQTVQNWGWPEDHMRMVLADEASNLAGVEIRQDALYLKDAGYLSPKKLCEFYAKTTPVHLNTRLETLQELDADIIILACGLGLRHFQETNWLPLNGVRGQVTIIKAREKSQKLRCNIGYGGYIAPAVEGLHVVGATFQRWLDHCEILPEDDTANLSHLTECLPDLKDAYQIEGHRASIRTASKDHFPIIGRFPGAKNIYISTGHGSHGIVTSLAGAELIADMITGRPLSQSRFSVNALAAERFQC